MWNATGRGIAGSFLLVTNNAAVDISLHVFLWMKAIVSLGHLPQSRFLGHIATLRSALGGPARLLSV